MNTSEELLDYRKKNSCQGGDGEHEGGTVRWFVAYEEGELLTPHMKARWCTTCALRAQDLGFIVRPVLAGPHGSGYWQGPSDDEWVGAPLHVADGSPDIEVLWDVNHSADLEPEEIASLLDLLSGHERFPGTRDR